MVSQSWEGMKSPFSYVGRYQTTKIYAVTMLAVDNYTWIGIIKPVYNNIANRRTQKNRTGVFCNGCYMVVK